MPIYLPYMTSTFRQRQPIGLLKDLASTFSAKARQIQITFPWIYPSDRVMWSDQATVSRLTFGEGFRSDSGAQWTAKGARPSRKRGRSWAPGARLGMNRKVYNTPREV